jgi:hypothetical protein
MLLRISALFIHISQPFSTFSTHFRLLDVFSSFRTRFGRSARALNSSHIFSNVSTRLCSRYKLSAPIFDFCSHFRFNAAHDPSTDYTCPEHFYVFLPALYIHVSNSFSSIFKYFRVFLTIFFFFTYPWSDDIKIPSAKCTFS